MTLTTIAELLIAGGTLAAAWYATRSADSSARATQGQLFAQLMDAYDDRSMAEALRRLRRWQETRAADFQHAIDDWADDQVSQRPSEATLELDERRRLVSHFFQKAARILDEQMLDGGLRDESVSLFGKQIMKNVVLPMDRALHSRQGSPSTDALDAERRFLKVFFPS